MSARGWELEGLIFDAPAEDQTLVEETLQALYDAMLADVIDVLTRRVIGPLPDGHLGDARERRLIDAGGRLQPTVRELLERLISIAEVPCWTDDMRRASALEAIGRSGF